MDVFQIDNLILFLIFFIPGFISIKIYDLLISGERRDFSKSLFEVMGYSALNFAAFSWLIILIHSNKFFSEHLTWYFLALFIVIFVSPILWPVIFLKLASWAPFSKHIVHPIQKPWDYVFGKREVYWIIVHLRDGRKIGGKYDINSFTSSYPAEEQIYLEEVWELDEGGKFIKPIDRSKGIIIIGKEILSVEFFT
jgi:hypothetical protein